MALTSKNMYKKPEVTLVTSWDDGTKYDLKIAGLLKKLGFLGTFYIVVDWIGKEGYLTWEDVKKIKSDGFLIGSHTMTHPMDLKKIHDEQLHVEIQTSKDLIENVLEEGVISFCYPRGRYDSRVRDMVINAGYMEARAVGKPGITKIEDKFALPGTIHIFQREEYGSKSILEYGKEVIDRLYEEGGYCNVWGHSAEIEKYNLWNILEELLRYIGAKRRGR